MKEERWYAYKINVPNNRDVPNGSSKNNFERSMLRIKHVSREISFKICS